MRVALVQETIDVQRGGAETSTLEMARHLGQLGLDVTILCRADATALPRSENVKFAAVPARGLTRVGRTYRFIQNVHRLHLRAQFHIVHAVTPCLSANVYQPRGGTYAETVARRVALVAPERRWLSRLGRVFNLRQRFLLRIEQVLLRKRRDQVFVAAVSEYVRRQVVSGYGFPAERTRVVFNGVDIAPLSADEVARARAALRGKLGVGPDTPLVLFVAHNFKLKGLTELIRACAFDVRPAGATGRPPVSAGAGSPTASPAGECPTASAVGSASSRASSARPPEWTLVVAGRDRPRRCQRLARQLAVAGRVRFVGTGTPIRQWYAAADLLAHPTWYDPCSRVVLEALSLGLPVVTTRLNGAAEAMEPGRHGEVIDSPSNIAELACAIARALRPELRDACRAAAGQVHERLSMARHARELQSLYKTVAAAEALRRRRTVDPT